METVDEFVGLMYVSLAKSIEEPYWYNRRSTSERLNVVSFHGEELRMGHPPSWLLINERNSWSSSLSMVSSSRQELNRRRALAVTSSSVLLFDDGDASRSMSTTRDIRETSDRSARSYRQGYHSSEFEASTECPRYSLNDVLTWSISKGRDFSLTIIWYFSLIDPCTTSKFIEIFTWIDCFIDTVQNSIRWKNESMPIHGQPRATNLFWYSREWSKEYPNRSL